MCDILDYYSPFLLYQALQCASIRMDNIRIQHLKYIAAKLLRNHHSDVIMVRWHLKSPASRLFTQPFVDAQIIENIKALPHWPLWGEFTGDRWIPPPPPPPPTKASDAENVSIWWRHHGITRQEFYLFWYRLHIFINIYKHQPFLIHELYDYLANFTFCRFYITWNLLAIAGGNWIHRRRVQCKMTPLHST